MLFRSSFVKTLELLRPLWLTLALGGDLLSARQKEQLTERFLERAGRRVTRRRKRPRRCPARGAPARAPVAAPAPQPVLGRPGELPTPANMNSRMALGLITPRRYAAAGCSLEMIGHSGRKTDVVSPRA